MRSVLMAMTLVAACSSAQMVGDPDARSPDAATADAAATDAPSPDAAAVDAATTDARSPDAATIDAAAIDAAGTDGTTATDAAPGPDAGCLIAGGADVTLDGVGDLAAYPAAQTVPVGAAFDGADALRLHWSPTALYLTVHSSVFVDGSRPYHLYLEAATALPAATPSSGKEYGGLIAQLPFTATHLIAIRRTDDFGTGGYDGVYLPGGATPWTTRATVLVPGTDVFASSDNAELSVRVPWAALGGCPTHLRVAGHAIYGAVANEWKTTIPAAHTPWMSPGGAAYTIDLTGPAAVSGWSM